MNKVHRIDLPRIVLVGREVIDSIGEISSELGVNIALVVTGKKTFEIVGERAQRILKDEGISTQVSIVSYADMETVERIHGQAEEMKVDALIGVGGGRTIDIAKLAAAKGDKYFISVPTTASHDGIASSSASVKGLGRPYTVQARSPIAVIADSEIISSAPYRFTASGCGDIISKAVAVRDWRLAHQLHGEYYGEYAASLALMSSSLIMKSALQIRDRLEDGYRTLLEALVSCGVAMSIAGSSRPCSGSAHLFSHALDMISPGSSLHGEQCGVGAIMMSKLHGLDWSSIKKSLEIIGAPVTGRELGINRDEVIEVLLKSKEIRPDRFTILNIVNLTKETAENLAEECGVI